MDEGRFILCRDCGAIHRVTAWDTAPQYSFSGGVSQETDANDWRAFMDQHAGHGLEPLRALCGQYFPHGSPADPMAVAYVVVTNGEREFLLRRSRRRIEEPIRFERIDGRLGEEVRTLEIQEREIRKELKLRFPGAPGQGLSEPGIDRFIELFREEIAHIDPKTLTVAEPSYRDERIAYAPLSGAVKDSLLNKCAQHFNREELEGLRRFIDNHSDESDVMTVVLRQQIPIEAF